MSATSAASDRFAQVRAVFHRLVELDAAQRAVHLDELEGTAPAVATEVRVLLERMDESDLHAAPPPVPPERLGSFRLLRRIGAGGMGEVYLAERVAGDFTQFVALKLVRETTLGSDLRRRFERERRILARLSHPHIAHLIDGGVAPDGRPWLALEYVPGEHITDWCRARSLDAPTRVRLFLQVCDAVAFAHRNLVVHRDLKPSNILMDTEGRPKLLDFGIARLLDSGNDGETQTLVAMTPAYAAPEQRDGGAITTATDVYQLGVVLRELLHGGPGATARGRTHDAAAPLRGELRLIVERATAAAPSQRYAAVAALADDLVDWLARRPLRSGIGGRRERMKKMLWQWRWPLTLAAGVLFALGGGALLAWREARVAQAHEREARDNFQALLSVVGTANPGHYAGREPPVGKWLVDAATRLQRDFGNDPHLLHESLVGIGHGLMNLERTHDAVPILRAAHEALRRDSVATRADELGLLKLLVLAQDDPVALAATKVDAARIELLAMQSPTTERGEALDALASAAGAMGRLGDPEAARAVFARADALSPDGAEMSHPQRENFWRQRGWVAQRALRLEEAAAAFTRSRVEQDAAPSAFSTLRRAELDLLRAETALLATDAAVAGAALAAAQPVIEAEYPSGHVERAHFHALLAYWRLLRREDALALDLALKARDALRQPEGAHSGRALAERLSRIALARAGRCEEAQAEGEDRKVDQEPRADAERAWLEDELRRGCVARP